MSKQKLFDEDSEDEVALITENEYAKKYDKWRQKEELHKLEQKYGSKALNSDASESSDSEDESDEPPEVSEETEAQFLKTLALLKTKDPRIYDPEFKLFDESEKKEPVQDTKSKTLTFADSDDDEDDGNIFSIEKKAEIIESDTKTQAKSDKHGKLKDYLIGKEEHIDDEVEKDLAPLKALWSDPKLNEGETFLRDYILNKRYLEDGDVGSAGDKVRDDEELAADEARVEEQGRFERAYNFRFEEPDHEYLKRFPRTMNYIRPKDDKRSVKRAEVRTRKEEEKKKKMEEIARLKALKLKEIQEKIEKIKEVTGNQELAFKEDDLASEFDPAEHDRRMREIFDEEYYGQPDHEKPECPELDEELEIENWDNYEPEREEGRQRVRGEGDDLHCEDDDFNMDADYDPATARATLIEEMRRALAGGNKRRNRKKKSKLAQLLTTEKPKYVPAVAEKSYDEYMEEYYRMDCEDVIGGDLPTRFKYRDVVPNDFGLTVEEILLADDKELTQWVPLKKILKHRPDHVEKGEAKTYAQRAADERLKRKMLPSLFKHLPEDPEIVVPLEEATKKKKKKKNNKQKDTINVSNAQETVSEDPEMSEDKKKEANSRHEENISQANNGEPKKKKKNKDKSTVEENSLDETDHKIVEVLDQNGGADIKRKRKKKNKSVGNDFIVENVQDAGPSHEISTQGNTESINNKDTHKLQGNADLTVIVERNNKKKKVGRNLNASSGKKGDPNKLKRKASDLETEQAVVQKKTRFNKGSVNKKMKFKQRDKFKKKNDDSQTNNPLSTLSDERLKAYGLNPKKYRGFLKYKKF